MGSQIRDFHVSETFPAQKNPTCPPLFLSPLRLLRPNPSQSRRLQIHVPRLPVVPAAIPLRSLKSLPFGAKIPTLLDGHSLTVTTLPADDLVSLNNVTVAAPILDDGELVIFGIDRFFDLNLRIESHSPEILGCSDPRNPNEAMVAKTAASCEARSKIMEPNKATQQSPIGPNATATAPFKGLLLNVSYKLIA